MGTATGCHKRVSGEDAAFHGLSAGRFTLIIPDRVHRRAGTRLEEVNSRTRVDPSLKHHPLIVLSLYVRVVTCRSIPPIHNFDSLLRWDHKNDILVTVQALSRRVESSAAVVNGDRKLTLFDSYRIKDREHDRHNGRQERSHHDC